MGKPELRNIATQRFGRFIALYPIRQTAAFKWQWVCVCDCGRVKVVVGGKLTHHYTKSCGCWDRDATVRRNRAHGKKHLPEYIIWKAMKQRCTNPKYHAYARYGGRGIAVCAEWRYDFLAFINHIGPKPSPTHSIDRYPNADGNYEPGNVRWATKLEQRHNQGSSSSHPSIVSKHGSST